MRLPFDIVSRRLAQGLVLILTVLAWCDPALAKDELPPFVPGKPANYAQLWIDNTAVVTPRAVSDTLADLDQQGTNFDHILVMTHGFDLDEETSTRQLMWLGNKFLHDFKVRGAQRVGLVGLQWHSDTQSTLAPTGGNYLQKVALARSAGRGPARQLLLALQARHPKAHISILGHSTGCELTTAALYPEIQYSGTKPFVETFEPGRELKILMHILVGSDIDYDITVTGKLTAAQFNDRVRLIWQTMVPLQPKDVDADAVLILRAHFFGRPAGSRFPKYTVAQLDRAVSERRLYLDSHEIPRSHFFIDYLNDERVQHMADTMKFLANPKAPKPEAIAELDAALAAPDKLEKLKPFLDYEDAGTVYYGLWRIERLLEKSSVHLTDDTYEDLVQMLRTFTQKIWRTQKESRCETIRRGIFPTKKMMTRGGAPPWARPKKWK